MTGLVDAYKHLLTILSDSFGSLKKKNRQVNGRYQPTSCMKALVLPHLLQRQVLLEELPVRLVDLILEKKTSTNKFSSNRLMGERYSAFDV